MRRSAAASAAAARAAPAPAAPLMASSLPARRGTLFTSDSRVRARKAVCCGGTAVRVGGCLRVEGSTRRANDHAPWHSHHARGCAHASPAPSAVELPAMPAWHPCCPHLGLVGGRGEEDQQQGEVRHVAVSPTAVQPRRHLGPQHKPKEAGCRKERRAENVGLVGWRPTGVCRPGVAVNACNRVHRARHGEAAGRPGCLCQGWQPQAERSKPNLAAWQQRQRFEQQHSCDPVARQACRMWAALGKSGAHLRRR